MSSRTQSPIRILCVERELELIALRKLLNDFPELVLAAEASCEAEALQHIQADDINVAIIDLGFPGADGIELTRQIRKLHP
ncbi:MAG: response regulator, partial [Cyanobacteria bacterium]|nr:response regulator [Cyanobacteriota bacterium]